MKRKPIVLNGSKSFRDSVVESVGDEIFSCYQCFKCSAGCPVSFAMDLLPHQIIRAVQFDLREKVLSSGTIWVCASCETCTTRCPNNIDIAEIMDVLRHKALESNTALKERNVLYFHQAFMDAIRKNGRIHELGMIAAYKMKSRKFFDDMRLGWEMLKRGKLKLISHKIKEEKEIKRLFEHSLSKEDR
ncbi:MAG: 4Fe-4S dicluster domain-containing protein [Thermodesulfobacteriota bacterium]|nr:4Fe-4S dicluster domain-containing protein [Thermodesulfobacteriota bacterium]